jgi:alpha-D-ribose 1-methylphosphonate 5-triphosphate diphosphatase PhnM
LTKNWSSVVTTPPFILTIFTTLSQKRPPGCKKAARVQSSLWEADAAIYMAEKMKTLGASVALVVTFGPTTILVAPSNVAQVVNYYMGNILVSKGPSFKGSISNINLNSAADINHLNIEKSNRLHASVISRVQAIAGRQRRASPSAAVQ